MGLPRTLVLATMLTALPAVASAQSAKEKKAASEKVKQAIAKSQAGDHEAAISLYNEAYKIIPQPLLLSNIGSEYQQMGKAVEARDFFCKYLEADPTGSNVGYATAQAKTLYIDLGGIKDVKDEDVCKPLVKPEEVKPPPEETTEPEKTPPPEPPPSKPEVRQSPLRWVGLGAGVLGAGVFGLGVYYGMKAKDISDEITNHPVTEPWPKDIAQMESDGKSYEKKQIIFMLGGGVALAAGVVMFLVAKPHTVERAAVIAPYATPDSFGLAAAGRF